MAFVGLVGLYACIVRRLRTEKRNPAHFIGFIGFLGLLQLLWLLCVVCLVVASLLLLWCFACVGCVVGYLSLSDKMKEERICFALCLYLVLVSLF